MKVNKRRARLGADYVYQRELQAQIKVKRVLYTPLTRRGTRRVARAIVSMIEAREARVHFHHTQYRRHHAQAPLLP